VICAAEHPPIDLELYQHAFTSRLLDDDTAFRVTYWWPRGAVPAGMKISPRKPPVRQPPMERRHGRTVCPHTGKLRYPNRLLAERQLARFAVSGDGRRREIATYLCEHCKAWHLTSREQRRAA
jgi:hypothetical protein